MEGSPPGNRMGTERKEETRAGTGNDLALMGSTPH